MDIIIVGCGKVGSALAEVLSDEHNITIIDKKESLVETATNDFDVMGIVGNCLQTEILEEANVSKTNIFIAVTASDEVNILSCLIAKKMGARHCIARVRSPEFDKQLVFMREELGISMMVNPDYNAANEIAKVLRYPEAINIESFAKGRVDLAEIRITSGSILDGVALSQLSRRLRLDVLICAVQRGEELIIPNGNFVLRAGDKIHMTASHSNMVKFFKSISAAYREKRVKSAVLIGGGRVAYHLAQQLIEMGVKVKIIEIDHERCLELSDRLNKVDISCADGTDHDILEEERVYDADAVVTLTGIDEENILLSLLAKNKGVEKVVTKVNRMSLMQLSDTLDLDSLISPKSITVNQILQYVRARQNSLGNSVTTLYRMVNDRLEAIEFVVRDKKDYVDVPLKKLKLRSGILIASIVRGNELIIPKGDDCLQVNDSVVVVTTTKGMHDLSNIFD
ncbi:Trk system potassium transporter TrkA [Ruminococcus flavefaciens]|uniref:Trk system potassium transporter TrkA n=1 Tax=Ruminococcus flavefaciens TaxID=1265 RepID=UPI0026F06D65|nr:Trk system potassium transporter TrkA [Ruminococcus flavefaciens]MDD7515307.1 Trk system potassium transporter TrkA [Ruminococcus flavefaciens]MDY5692582.1 Trk system potassium transporter TrkA [Ruminococcus flavefaciens]